MRWLFILLVFCCATVKAQVISGKIVSDSTNLPVAARLFTHSGYQTATDAAGSFNLQVKGADDTIKVFAIGYQTLIFPVKAPLPRYIVLRVKTALVNLKEVTVKAERNHQKDSIDRRAEYSKVFNYQPTKLKDAFVAPPSNVPFTFVSIDLLRVISALTRNSDPKYKLQKVLQRDEQGDYIATRFNRSLVSRVTGLKGDSLQTYMDKYYPKIDWVKKASDYDILLYIKEKASDFRKGN